MSDKSNKYNKIKVLYENKEAIDRLKDLFNWFIFSKGINVDLDDLVKEYSDVEIYAILHGLYEEKFGQDHLAELKKKGLVKASIRRFKIVNDIVHKNYYKHKDLSILDVGTEDCTYIDMLEKLGKSYAINIETSEFSSYVTDKSCITHYDGVHIPYDDNSMDLITCTMVIHHMDEPHETLNEMYRVLKPGGLLFIKEHDSDSKYTNIIIDAEHFMHGMIINPTFDTIYYNNYTITYYSKKQMNTLIMDSGFKNISHHLPKRYKRTWGATRKYYGLYVKSKNVHRGGGHIGETIYMHSKYALEQYGGYIEPSYLCDESMLKYYSQYGGANNSKIGSIHIKSSNIGSMNKSVPRLGITIGTNNAIAESFQTDIFIGHAPKQVYMHKRKKVPLIDYTKKYKKLRRLMITFCQIGDDGVDWIIKMCKKVDILILFACQFDNYYSICKLMSNLGSVITLSLMHNEQFNRIPESMCDMLKENKLRHFTFMYAWSPGKEEDRDINTMRLFESMKDITKLRSFSCDMFFIMDPDINFDDFVYFVRNCKNLELLNLRTFLYINTRYKPKKDMVNAEQKLAKQLWEAIKYNRKITKLKIDPHKYKTTNNILIKLIKNRLKELTLYGGDVGYTKRILTAFVDSKKLKTMRIDNDYKMIKYLSTILKKKKLTGVVKLDIKGEPDNKWAWIKTAKFPKRKKITTISNGK